MNILAFDTSFSTCSVGLLYNGQISTIDRFAPMQQSKLILPLIDELLASHALSLNSLDAIAYGCGPGSFTGVRVAKCVAQGIALAVQKQVIPVSSMAILAQSALQKKGWEKVAVCIDARMGQIHWAEYVTHHGSTIVTLNREESVYRPEKIKDSAFLTLAGWHGVGDGWLTYQTRLLELTGIEAESIDVACEPQASAILVLAEAAMKAKPYYLR